MFKNAYLLAKIGADTPENERKFAKFVTKNCNDPTRPATLKAEGGTLRERRPHRVCRPERLPAAFPREAENEPPKSLGAGPRSIPRTDPA